MEEPFISQISTKRTPSGEAHYVRVPKEWAERMARNQVRHVVVEEKPDFPMLTLHPITGKTLERHRAEKKRARQRDASRRRYYRDRIAKSG